MVSDFLWVKLIYFNPCFRGKTRVKLPLGLSFPSEVGVLCSQATRDRLPAVAWPRILGPTCGMIYMIIITYTLFICNVPLNAYIHMIIYNHIYIYDYIQLYIYIDLMCICTWTFDCYLNLCFPLFDTLCRICQSSKSEQKNQIRALFWHIQAGESNAVFSSVFLVQIRSQVSTRREHISTNEREKQQQGHF